MRVVCCNLFLSLMLLSAWEVSASTESEEAFNKKEIRKTYSDNIHAEQSQ